MTNYLGVRFFSKEEAGVLQESGKITGPYERRSIESRRLGVTWTLSACRRQAEKFAKSKGYDIIVPDGFVHDFNTVWPFIIQDYVFYRADQ